MVGDDHDLLSVPSPTRLDRGTPLHQVVDRGEVEVHYQPQVSLTDSRIVGAEALVRWNHPEHGILAPARFIPLAEDDPTVLPIERLVLERACRQARTWQQEFGVTLQIGVNLSARQFRQDDLAYDVARVLRATAIEPAQLCLEITESLAMDDVELTSAVVARLHALGVRVAIDDFGTGPSSLGYLARFPTDVVKVDQGFACGIDQDPIRSAIVAAVVALSESVGSTTVVEGVDTRAQIDELRDLGCDLAQGSAFSPPLPAAAFGKLLTATMRPAAPEVSAGRWARAG